MRTYSSTANSVRSSPRYIRWRFGMSIAATWVRVEVRGRLRPYPRHLKPGPCHMGELTGAGPPMPRTRRMLCPGSRPRSEPTATPRRTSSHLAGRVRIISSPSCVTPSRISRGSSHVTKARTMWLLLIDQRKDRSARYSQTPPTP
jgi:hypothetical protein